MSSSYSQLDKHDITIKVEDEMGDTVESSSTCGLLDSSGSDVDANDYAGDIDEYTNGRATAEANCNGVTNAAEDFTRSKHVSTESASTDYSVDDGASDNTTAANDGASNYISDANDMNTSTNTRDVNEANDTDANDASSNSNSATNDAASNDGNDENGAANKGFEINREYVDTIYDLVVNSIYEAQER